MASGMEYMLKTLGIDPKEITLQVEGFKSAFLDIAAKLGNIERQNNVILANQKTLCEKLEVPYARFQPDKQSAPAQSANSANAASGNSANGSGKTAA